MPDPRTWDNEINLPDVYNGLGVALNIMNMNNCFRVVVGCVADWQQETRGPMVCLARLFPGRRLALLCKLSSSAKEWRS
jgi:hypothetical protein